MSIKTKINKKLTESSTWILNSPDSLVILMLMGTGIAFLFFGVFSAALGFNGAWFLTVLFGVFSLMALKQFIKIFRLVRRLGLKNALGNISANEFVWHKGGKEDGNNGSIEADEVCNEQDGRSNEIGKEGHGTDNSESERTNAWSRIMLERSGSDVDKNGVSKGRNA